MRPARLLQRAIHPRPLGDFYNLLLKQPLPSPHLSPLTTLTPNPLSTPTPTPPTATPAERAAIVFGSRLLGPNLGPQDERPKGKTVAGVYVPPKPVEPDNCCMSGCVNCVLETFVEDLEEWKQKSREAKRALEKKKKKKKKMKKGEVALADGMDEDGGGNGDVQEGLWEGFEDIDMGLRVFMENERKIKKRREAEAKAKAKATQ